MAALDPEELARLTLGRQFPVLASATPAGVLEGVGPMQTQTARSTYAGLVARVPEITAEQITTSFEKAEIVRGSSIRGTVHTSSAPQQRVLDAVSRLGQRRFWERSLRLQAVRPGDVWAAQDEYARDTWRSAEELTAHQASWLQSRGEAGCREEADGGLGRYLAFGVGLVRRPVTGSWAGQSAPEYRSAESVTGLSLPEPRQAVDEAVRMHLAAYGPASRRDLAWWTGLGLRVVDDALARADLRWYDGPGGQVLADLPDAPAPAEVPGVRLLPEFDALMCAYHPTGRMRFATPNALEVLWNRANGLMLAPVLVDGRIGGHWRLEGTGRSRTLQVLVFAGGRPPRPAELKGAATILVAALDLDLAGIEVQRD